MPYAVDAMRSRQMKGSWRTLVIAGILMSLSAAALPQTPPAKREKQSLEERLRRLEDYEEIRHLLNEYGRTLDQRDFAAFSRLFAAGAEYGSGAGAVKGPAAIANLLEETFRKNPSGVGSPNYHVFANVSIQVDGDEAVAISKGAFVVPGGNNRPEIVMLATYTDSLKRENGRWKFLRRVVHGDIPPPAATR